MHTLTLLLILTWANISLSDRHTHTQTHVWTDVHCCTFYIYLKYVKLIWKHMEACVNRRFLYDRAGNVFLKFRLVLVYKNMNMFLCFKPKPSWDIFASLLSVTQNSTFVVGVPTGSVKKCFALTLRQNTHEERTHSQNLLVWLIIPPSVNKC